MLLHSVTAIDCVTFIQLELHIIVVNSKIEQYDHAYLIIIPIIYYREMSISMHVTPILPIAMLSLGPVAEMFVCTQISKYVHKYKINKSKYANNDA